MTAKTQSLFSGSFAKKYGETGPVSLSNKEIVRSVSDSNTEIIRWIMALYCPNGFDLDPTYSIGNFYRSIKEPKFKFDLVSSGPEIVPADASELPIKDNSINSIMFDPPFVGGSRRDGKPGIIKVRFGYYKNIQDELWDMYSKALNEFYRVLKPGGVVVFKCQDSVESGKQYITHVEIMNRALQTGFYPKDLFILTAKNRIIKQERQFHARKFHSYFWVFIKQKSPVDYNEGVA